MITLHQLTIINEVVKEHSLTRAASNLHLSQSALSHQIRDLEHRLGLPVFSRQGKKLHLTEYGKRLLATAEVVMPEMDSLLKDLREIKEGRVETIRLATECHTCYSWLPAIFPRFKTPFPNTKIEIVLEATADPFQALLENKIDLAICNYPKAVRHIRADRIFDDALIAVISAEHPFALKNKSLTCEDFNDQHLIVHNLRTNKMNTGLLQRLKPLSIMELQLTEAIIEMVKAAMGVAIMPNWAAEPYLKSGHVKTVPFQTKLTKRTWYAARQKNGSASIHYLVGLLKTLKGAFVRDAVS